MDNQLDQRRTHTTGHENHGVQVCNKCGWSYPNPHPSAKHRRAHKKICGTIEGYKLCASEEQAHLNVSDDEHVSETDSKTTGLVVSAPNNLDTGKIEKGNDGIRERLVRLRSEDEVFSDAVEDFSDIGLSPGTKEPLKQDCLDSDVGLLIVKSSDDCQNENHSILQFESVEVGNTLDLQGELPDSIVDPLPSSIANSGTEESTFVHSNDFFDLSSDSPPYKAETLADVLRENKINAGENVTDCSLISVAKDTNLGAKDEIKSDVDVAENVDSSDNVVDETCGVSEVAVSGAISSDHQMAEEAVMLMEKNSAEFLSMQAHDDFPLALNSDEVTNALTNDVQVESAHVKQFSTSSDVNILQEKGEGNADADMPPTCDNSLELVIPQSEHEGFNDLEGVVSQGPLSQPSESLKHDEDEQKSSATEENTFVFIPNQLTKKSVLSPDVHVVSSTSSMKKELVNFEPMPEDTHVEEHIEITEENNFVFKPVQSTEKGVVSSTNSMKKESINFEHTAEETNAEENIEVSPVKVAVESCDRLDEIGESMNAIETEINESHIIPFSEEQEIIDGCKVSQQISLPEGSLVASSNENPKDASFDSATSEKYGVISIDNASHHDKNSTAINNVVVGGNNVRAGVESDTGTIIEDLQLNGLPQWEDTQSSDIIKSDDAGEMSKVEKCDITESLVISEAVVDATTRKATGIECTNISPISAPQEDIKKDEFNSNIIVHEEYNRPVDPSADSNPAQDSELIGKAAENLARKYAPLSLNTGPSAQHDSAVEDNQDGEQGRKVSRIPAVPFQDRTVNSLVKHSSSGFDASVDSSSRCDSLEGNWGSVSVISLQFDAPAVIDTENLPSEMFEPPSKAAASEVQKGSNSQQQDSISQAGWFPTLTQAINESPERKKNEEIIAKVTNWSTCKEHTPLKSLLGEAAHSSKAKPPKFGGHSLNQKIGKLPENSSSGLTTLNSILSPELPAAEAAKGQAAKEWNSPARYPADIKREKGKVKNRPFWIQLVCCSSVDHQPQKR
ncbi:PREDICTED: uncharacterized protein LOC109349381 [Lupinus angustifolius]|uniref:uncharacterized protein LOC109349381 n=1 Tax=Lupinus angustifolius TaxID=3871 RepID=UPI00092E6250|nr:PREDICTED: uncharacterized protein LOC109349381 [Lupinus angustifolius]